MISIFNTHAEAAAKISIRRAFVAKARTIANKIVNPQTRPNLAPISCTKYSATIDDRGTTVEKTVPKIYITL